MRTESRRYCFAWGWEGGREGGEKGKREERRGEGKKRRGGGQRKEQRAEERKVDKEGEQVKRKYVVREERAESNLGIVVWLLWNSTLKLPMERRMFFLGSWKPVLCRALRYAS